jgi:hypothetical protein
MYPIRVGLSRAHNGSRFPILAFMTTVTANQKMYLTRMYLPVTGYERREVVPKRHPALVIYSVPSVRHLKMGTTRVQSSFLLIIFIATCDAAFELCTVHLVNLPALSLRESIVT